MPRKKKPESLPWDRVQPVVFSDAQWQKINRRVQLPNEARRLIERNVNLYEFHKRNHQGYPTPGAIRSELESAHKMAARLSHAFEKMSESAGYALLDTTEQVGTHGPKQIWTAHLECLDKITAAFPPAIAHSRKQKRKAGTNTFAVDHLIKHLDEIHYRYRGKHIGREKLFADYIASILNIADKNLGPGAIDAALKRLKHSKKEK